jgi:hydroxyacylglutathione hydrolase
VPREFPTVAIVGAGASGALLAVHLLANPEAVPFRLVLFDPANEVGRGVAFSTSLPSHLLNVPAVAMSAFAEDPHDFVSWLEQQGVRDAPKAFVPRSLFGAYLSERFETAARASDHVRVEVVHDRVVDINHFGCRPVLELGGGKPFPADLVVLATGLAPPAIPSCLSEVSNSDRYIGDPWHGPALSSIKHGDSVTIIGTGLTAVDVALALGHQGHTGPIRAVSRHGLLPRTHRVSVDCNPDLIESCASLDVATARELLTSVRELIDRAERSGSDWRQIVDALRPHVDASWQGLDLVERQRFLRHFARYWDVHRHRMAPQIAEWIGDLQCRGRLVVHKGRISEVQEFEEGLIVRLGDKADPAIQWTCQWLINCTGPPSSICSGADLLVTRLAQRGIVRPGPLEMGVDTDRRSQLRDRVGRPVPWLWAMGSLLRGRLYETTAVPEIRTQAQVLSGHVLSEMAAMVNESSLPRTADVAVKTPALPSASPKMEVVTFESPDIGDHSYLVHDGKTAIVIDPQCDIDRILVEATRRQLAISHVLETHIHNDYVSGGLALSRASRATYVISADEPVGFSDERLGVRDGEVLSTGALSIEVVHTPGHTPHHLSYAVRSGEDASVLFSGGSILNGSTGRTDLFDEQATELLARAQWHSVRRLVDRFEPATMLFPTHGFGSFCSLGPSKSEGSGTLQDQRETNPALRHDEWGFVNEVLQSRSAFPSYYRHMAPLNRSGWCPSFPATIDRIDAGLLAEQSGSVVVDLRPRRTFARGHLLGAINVEWADSFAAYFGWSVPWGATPITLVAQDWATIERAAGALARVGIRRLDGVLHDSDLDQADYRVANFADLKSAMVSGDRAALVDAREPGEWEQGHITGANLIPFHCIEAATSLFKVGEEIWVHCARGYRAAIAASLLARYGHRPVLIDDSFEHARELGLVELTHVAV